MTYHVTTHQSYLRWKEGVKLDAVTDMLRETFFPEAEYANYGLYDLLGLVFGQMTTTSTVPRLFYAKKKDAPLGDEEAVLYMLAPSLEDGSYLRYRGEDGDFFGWQVHEGEVYPQLANLEWVYAGAAITGRVPCT